MNIQEIAAVIAIFVVFVSLYAIAVKIDNDARKEIAEARLKDFKPNILKY